MAFPSLSVSHGSEESYGREVICGSKESHGRKELQGELQKPGSAVSHGS